MRELQITTQQIDGIHIVHLAGVVEPLSFTTLASTLTRLIHEDVPCVVLDCRRVAYISSAQLKELLDLARYARARGGDIKCFGLSPTIQQVAVLVANGDPMDCYDALTPALTAFHGIPSPTTI
jgi:anti-anti-sigma factor